MTRGFDERFYPRHVEEKEGVSESIPDYRNPTIAIIEHFKPPGPRGGREGRSF
jgi:hypothetical protein